MPAIAPSWAIATVGVEMAAEDEVPAIQREPFRLSIGVGRREVRFWLTKLKEMSIIPRVKLPRAENAAIVRVV